jgi:hypothetical protein
MSLTDKLIEHARRCSRAFGAPFPQPSIEPFAGKVEDVPELERCSTGMHRSFYENTDFAVHKWRNYLGVYDRHLSRFRETNARILEIGVFRGGSLAMWRRYFGEKAVIFGVDIDPSCLRFNGKGGQVRIGSQADPYFLKNVLEEMGGVDVVIDDGSHVASHQRASFDTIFPLVDDHGIYICEDTHTAYWRGHFEGGYRRPLNFIEKAKRLVDDLYVEFHGKKQSVANAHHTILSVSFYNSMVVIEKAPQPPMMAILING